MILTTFVLGGLLLTPAVSDVAGSAEVPESVRLDADGDGIPEPQDVCPASPARARPVAHGCAAVELVHSPRVLFEPALDRLDEMGAELGRGSDWGDASRWLTTGRSDVAAAAEDLHAGTVCKASKTMDNASAALRRAGTSMSEAVEMRSAELLARTHTDEHPTDGSDAHDRGHIDVSREHITVGFLRQLDSQVAEAVASAIAVGRPLSEMCSSVAGNLRTNARVTGIDDASGLVHLEGGRVIGLGAGAQKTPLQEGVDVSIKGVLFDDGTGVTDDIKATSNVPPSDDIAFGPCLELRIAPVQRFWPYANTSVLHHPDAYDDGTGALQLEEGMRFAASAVACSFDPPPGQFGRVTMEIRVIDGTQLFLVPEAEDLEDPVAFPAFAGEGDEISIVQATVYKQSCSALADGTNKCSAALKHSDKSYWVRLRPRGTYATAVYSQTEFKVTGNPDPDHFDTGAVVDTDLTDVTPDTNPSFAAEGYPVTNGSSSRPQVLPVTQGEQFAVYADDIYPPDGVLFPEDATGVDKASALIWPRVVGSRNNHEFWYSAELPDIQRDLLDVCPDDPATSYADPDSYYKLPFVGGWPTWDISFGNTDDPTSGHADQTYAWDIDAPEHTDIHAARPGVVTWVVEDEYLNSKDYPPGYKGIGNYIHIKHEDGTYGVYFHLVQWGSLVAVGDKVVRGQHIGEVGNTGQSGGNHLHWELSAGNGYDADGDLLGAASLPTRYEAYADTDGGFPPEFTFRTCYLPRAAHDVLSTQ